MVHLSISLCFLGHVGLSAQSVVLIQKATGGNVDIKNGYGTNLSNEKSYVD